MYSMRLIHSKKGKKKEEEKLCLRIEYACTCIRINVSSYTFIFYKC